MNATQLLAHFERVSDTADAIPRLRCFIRDLAVRGKLVPQDRKDAPVPSSIRVINAADGAFPIPSTWGWVNVGSVADARLGKMLDKAKNKGVPKPYLRNINVRWFDFDLSDLFEMPFEDTELSEFALRLGDVLICEGGEPGRAAVWDGRAAGIYFQKAIHRVRLKRVVDPTFFVNALRASADDGRLMESFTGTGIKHFTGKSLDAYCLPLPPLAEQHRIVARINELMTLCDRLEAARAERESRRDLLAASSLARLNTPDQPDTFENDVQFALKVLPSLTMRPDQLQRLRLTILNLAVRGKLVVQDPLDEPASELLKRIARAKAEQKRKTNDARIKLVPDPDTDGLGLQAPLGWAVQSFENLFLFIDYRGNTPPKTNDGIPLITAKNIRMGYLNREPREYISNVTFKSWMTRGFPKIGDLFFTTEAPLANICLNDIEEPFALAQRAICFQPYGEINTKFLMFALMSDVMQSLIDSHATGMTAKGIKAAKLKPLPIPVPPLSEQHRIVAKIDELMALCDRLEANLKAAEERRDGLLSAILGKAVRPTEERDEAA